MRPLKFSALALCACLCVPAQAQEALPSFELVRQQYRDNNQDLLKVSYLYRRCAALHLNVSSVLLRKKQPKPAQEYEKLASHYMLMSEAVDKELDQRLGLKTAKSMTVVSLAVKHLSEIYSQRLQTNLKLRGEYIANDLVLESELAECIDPDVFANKLGRKSLPTH